MIAVRVQAGPFDTGAELAGLTAGRTDVGGVASFTGLVRGGPADGNVLAMTLEQYPAMTLPALEAIAAEAWGRWPLLAGVVVHRFGRLLAGEPIVLVATASAHRQAALESTAFLMDWLKVHAPFWKREETAAGARWVDARAADDAAAERWGVATP